MADNKKRVEKRPISAYIAKTKTGRKIVEATVGDRHLGRTMEVNDRQNKGKSRDEIAKLAASLETGQTDIGYPPVVSDEREVSAVAQAVQRQLENDRGFSPPSDVVLEQYAEGIRVVSRDSIDDVVIYQTDWQMMPEGEIAMLNKADFADVRGLLGVNDNDVSMELTDDALSVTTSWNTTLTLERTDNTETAARYEDYEDRLSRDDEIAEMTGNTNEIYQGLRQINSATQNYGNASLGHHDHITLTLDDDGAASFVYQQDSSEGDAEVVASLGGSHNAPAGGRKTWQLESKQFSQALYRLPGSNVKMSFNNQGVIVSSPDGGTQTSITAWNNPKDG